jgi:hypothetical protein
MRGEDVRIESTVLVGGEVEELVNKIGRAGKNGFVEEVEKGSKSA